MWNALDLCASICTGCFLELTLVLMLSGAVFDLDGVLANSHPIHLASWKSFLTSVGIATTDEDLEIIRDGRTKEELLRHFMGDLSDDELCKYAAEKDRIYGEHVGDLAPVRGVRYLLHELRSAGIKLAVASSGSGWRVHQTLDLLRLSNYFHIVSTADEFKARKSSSAIFLATAQRMQVRCEQAVVFEDSDVAIHSAKTIGMKCIGIADAVRSKALIRAGAERTFPNFLQISLVHLQSLFSVAPTLNSSSHAQDCSV